MVRKEKIEMLQRLKELIKQYPVIGIANLENLPAPQLQNIREKLKDKVKLIVVKKRILQRAFNELGNGLEKLNEFIKGIAALILTKESPFRIYKIIEENKTPSYARAGQVATKDIYVKAGPTAFTPGPILGELGQLGIKAGVEAGKIVIKEDKLLVKEGEIINEKVAEILSRLDIKPMEIGLNVYAFYENGIVYSKDVLTIDEKEVENNIITFARNALLLTLAINYPTKENIEIVIGKAYNEARSLAREARIITKDTINDIIVEAQHNAQVLEGLVKYKGI